jgi:hypothetical protein
MINYTVTMTNGKEYRTIELRSDMGETTTWTQWVEQSGIAAHVPPGWRVLDITNEEWFSGDCGDDVSLHSSTEDSEDTV